MDNSNKVFFWIATKKYIPEAIQSARSVKQHMSDIDCVLFTDTKDEFRDIFDKVILLPPKSHKLWYVNFVKYMNIALDLMYEKFIYLDTDTFMCHPIYDVFDMLDTFDLMSTHAPGRLISNTINNIPDGFVEFNTGVLAFKKSSKITYFFSKWFETYNDYSTIYGENDQAVLRDVLWGWEGRVYVLPPEYNFRFPFGGFLRGKCRILHGRSKMKFEAIEKIVNEDWRAMRTFAKGKFR